MTKDNRITNLSSIVYCNIHEKTIILLISVGYSIYPELYITKKVSEEPLY